MEAITQNKSSPKKIFVCIAIFLALFVSSPFFIAYAAIPEIERQALIALYNSTGGDNWKDNDGWKTSPLHTDGFAMPGTECTWYGITCNYGNTAVEVISLRQNQLTGSIPPELGNLENLIHLYLESNQLAGGIPKEFSNMDNLIALNLSHNQLTGSIPTELSNMANLGGLSVDHNQLSGIIPPEMANLWNLTQLDLSFNKLSSKIPPEICNLRNLIWLSLESNRLSGSIPQEIGNLYPLYSLYLNDNLLSGEIPRQLMNLRLPPTSRYFPFKLNICNNFLYTDDLDLRDFLNYHQPQWESCQRAAFFKSMLYIPLLLLDD